MVKSTTVFNLLRVKESEWAGFINMVGHSFFNALALAFSFTAINVMLIEFHGIEQLPWIYLFGAAFILIGGKIYSKLEAKTSATHLFAGVLVFCILWALMARNVAHLGEMISLVALLYGLYLLIYQLSNLEFWGVASLLYDVRQSKRLFGMLSTGESVAKISGYLLSPLIVSALSLADLFYFAAGAYFISLLFLIRISKIHKKDFHLSHSTPHNLKAKNTISFAKKLRSILPSLKDPFLKYAGLFALFSTLVFYLIHYSFLSRVELQYKDADQLALFFGFFFSAAKFLNLIIKGFFYSRMFKVLKIGQILLILPFILGIMSILGLAGPFLYEDSLIFYLYIFALIMMVEEIFRTSIYLPSFFILFQPLRKEKRLEGHTLAKGFMEPLGMAAAGILMLLLIWQGYFQLSVILVLLAGSIAIWIFIGHRLSVKYNELVRFLLKNRLLKSESVEFSIENLEELNNSNLSVNDPAAVIYHLKLLGDEVQQDTRLEQITNLLNDPNPIILLEALELAEKYPDLSLLPPIKKLMDSNHQEVSKRSIFLYCREKQAESLDDLKDKIESSSGAKREFFIAAILKYCGIYAASIYGSEILNLLKSTQIEDRKAVARIVFMINRSDYYHPLAVLLEDPSIEVRREAIKAVSGVLNLRLLPKLISIVVSDHLFRHSAIAIESFGESAIPFLKEELEKNHRLRIKVRILQLVGRIHSSASTDLLRKYLFHPNFDLRTKAINGLFHLNYISHDQSEQQKIDELLKFEYQIYAQLQKTKDAIEGSNETGLQQSLSTEITTLKHRLLKIMGLLYGNKIIQLVHDNLLTGDFNHTTNAIELLENNMRPRHSRMLTPILDGSHPISQSGDQHHIDPFVSGKFSMGVSEWLLAFLVRNSRINGQKIENKVRSLLKNIQSDVIDEELNLLKI